MPMRSVQEAWTRGTRTFKQSEDSSNTALSSHEVAFNTDIRSLRSTSECSVMHFANKNSKERLLEERFSLHSDGSGGEWVMLNGLLRHPESMTIVTQGVAAGAVLACSPALGAW